MFFQVFRFPLCFQQCLLLQREEVLQGQLFQFLKNSMQVEEVLKFNFYFDWANLQSLEVFHYFCQQKLMVFQFQIQQIYFLHLIIILQQAVFQLDFHLSAVYLPPFNQSLHFNQNHVLLLEQQIWSCQFHYFKFMQQVHS